MDIPPGITNAKMAFPTGIADVVFSERALRGLLSAPRRPSHRPRSRTRSRLLVPAHHHGPRSRSRSQLLVPVHHPGYSSPLPVPAAPPFRVPYGAKTVVGRAPQGRPRRRRADPPLWLSAYLVCLGTGVVPIGLTNQIVTRLSQAQHLRIPGSGGSGPKKTFIP